MRSRLPACSIAATTPSTSSRAACGGGCSSPAASLHEPKLVLLDEPTVGLDPQIRAEIWTLIEDLRAAGTTILMSTHYIEEAERLADEVALMAKGRVIARGRPGDLIAEHAGERTAEYYAPPARRDEVRAAAEAAGLLGPLGRPGGRDRRLRAGARRARSRPTRSRGRPRWRTSSSDLTGEELE